ncbi:MAG: hypothetical protein L0177_12245 [Chloroflexi bacterium]|nr:hypothetical protein [Chloroflexota bacterium]
MRQMVIGALALLAVAAIACVYTPAPTTQPTAPPSEAQQPSGGETATSQPSSPPETPFETAASFFLEVITPQDELVLASPSIEVKGMTTPDAVVSVNDTVAEVNADGSFSTTVVLEEGPNIIEVLSSDFQGNEESKIITVIYAPS